MRPWVVITSFFILIGMCMIGGYMGITEAKTAVPWISGAFCSELAHLARKSVEDD